MLGSDTKGNDYEIEVTRGVTFRAYGTADSDRLEVSVEEGVITVRLPDELCQWEARALAALLMEAADELERQTAPVMVPAGYVDIGGGIYAEAGREALGGEK